METYKVTTTADYVPDQDDTIVGSLRYAIEQANANQGADRIEFELSPADRTITLIGGEILITDSLTILGSGITVSGNKNDEDKDKRSRVFNIDDDDNSQQSQIFIDSLIVKDGFAFDGGGILNRETTTIANSTIAQNVSNTNTDRLRDKGGGIRNDPTGQLRLINSTVLENSASFGGGIYNEGQIYLINSTISGNSAISQGGGIYNSRSATLVNNTIAENTAKNQSDSGGGVYNKNSGTATIINTIIAKAKNSSGDFTNQGTLTTDSTNNILGDDGTLNLDSLKNNGGSTLTYALLDGSSAIDAGDRGKIPADSFDLDGDGDKTEPIPILYDQRGNPFVRIVGNQIDIGAYEYVSDNFDPAQYGASYEDLIKTFGYNLQAFRDHYNNYGKAEKRSKDLFDEFRYIASSNVNGGDLINFYGLDGAGATEHYIRYGQGEGRSLTAFDPARYLDSYSQAPQDDLLKAFNTDTLAATQHYIANGFKEGRNPNLFPSDRYIASHGDLIEAFHYNLEAGSNHYLFNGRGEGRQVTFDPSTYMTLNSDVARWANNDPILATWHYITYGYDERRPTM